MNKKQLINDIAKRAEMTRVEAGFVLNEFLDAVASALIAGERISLVGFGQFTVNHVPKRQGRNPQTGKKITIAARNKPVFKPGKKLKEAVR
ncbi:HU family DNA-binding protein [Pseudomonas sp. KU43P]|uniref:HU family DNA-binding protein n=1 Tax=Pseudomonas sp. KU43P TaxID=2487887 RepID=UPI0012A977F4|nr:HU family DNA-binding protein [Pseudomonas sp. KU43P]BBH47051.1 DNA-binding protein HU-alpha [Pseudomonas sp. KU43P]